MNITRKALIFLFILLAITSCGSNPIYIDRSYTLDDKSNLGIVVGSISQTSTNRTSSRIQSSSRIYSDKGVYVGNISTEMPTIDKSVGTDIADVGLSLLISIPIAMLTGGASGAISVSTHKSKLSVNKHRYKEGVGYVFALKLPPGKYYFENWNVFDGPRSNDNYEPRKFTVTKGKVTYIGNLHMILGKISFKFFSVSTYRVESAQAVFRDEFERDINIFRSFYPKLSKLAVQKKLVTLGPWEMVSR